MAVKEENTGKNLGAITFTDLKNPRIKFVYGLLVISMIFISCICLLPPLWVMLSSMKDVEEFFRIPPTIIPETFHPEKLLEMWSKLDFFKYYWNTIVIAVGSIACSILFNGLTGYVLSRLKPKGSKIIFNAMLWTMMIPSSVGMIPLFKIFIDFPIVHFNLSNTPIPMWLMAGANAYYIIIFKSFFDNIQNEYIEAARIDGCDDLSIFFKIILPLSKAVVTVVGIFTLTGVWSDFLWPYLLLKDVDKYTVMVKIFTMTNFRADQQMIALTFAIIPPAVLFIIFHKKIISGFSLGGIKG